MSSSGFSYEKNVIYILSKLGKDQKKTLDFTLKMHMVTYPFVKSENLKTKNRFFVYLGQTSINLLMNYKKIFETVGNREDNNDG